MIHSTDPKTGGVVEAVFRLNASMEKKNTVSIISDDRHFNSNDVSLVIAHGLWQWPGYKAWKNFKKTGVPYVVFPHGMLDPWFKKNYPLKHLKKQCLLVVEAGGKSCSDAHAVCFTTEEERLLAQKTFFSLSM